MKQRFRAIGTRLIVTAAVMTALLVGTLAVVTMMMHRQDLMDHVSVHAHQLSGTVQRALRYSMLRYDRENLEQAITDVGREEGIQLARIFNKAGAIVYSSNPDDLGVVVPKTEDGCIQCHASETPVIELERGEATQIFERNGHRSFGVVTPIYNEPACSRDPCHQHPEGQHVLGVLYMTTDLSSIDAELRETTIFVIAFAVLIIITLAVFLGFFVQRFIRRPVRELTTGVLRVASGDLDYQIQEKWDTELGDLARSFNQMTVDLKKARAEIEEWGRNCEERVKERTRELEDAQAQLLQSEKLASLGKLAASVAHEINNPLMGVLTFIRTFQGWVKERDFPAEKNDEFRQDLDIMGRETMRISKIVRSLLAFARRSKLDRQEQDVNELLRQCVALLHHQLELQEIEIVAHFGSHIPQVRIDGGQFQQAVMNLLINAAEAMGSGGKLTLSSSYAEEERELRVRISDTGPGIPDDILPKIFDPFFTTKEPGKGTGLGLPVVYGIVHRHGGRLDLSTQAGEGTTFEIILPIDAETDAESDEEAEEAATR
ncbi:MAG: HAMP domain-containing protein [Candidatus Eisenbacteria bacterium]|nr:HAMP domain-containing protein [Candidatus Eisenbacteria bacterium]